MVDLLLDDGSVNTRVGTALVWRGEQDETNWATQWARFGAV
jgi:hypothetical protein